MRIMAKNNFFGRSYPTRPELPISTVFTCVDPDPYANYGSGSTNVLNTEQILIAIHHTALLIFITWQDACKAAVR